MLVAVFGLLVGSFINAWVWRTYMQLQVANKHTSKYSLLTGRSICPHCKHQLSSLDLIPVLSWIHLRGKCRYCSKTISWQYPLVELATAILFGLSYVFWPYGEVQGAGIIEFGAWLALLASLVALAVYDLKHMLLPNKMVIVAAVPVVAWTIYQVIVPNMGVAPILSAAYGSLAFGGVFYVLFEFSKGEWIGGGDVKLGFVLGAWLASPMLSLLAIFSASLIGVIIFVALSFKKSLTLKSKIPFGPMLIIGFVLAFFFGSELLAAYSNSLLGL